MIVIIRGASPLGLPYARSRAAARFDKAHRALSAVEGRRRAPLAWLASLRSFAALGPLAIQLA